MDRLLREPAAGPLLERYGREAVKEEIRRAIGAGVTDRAAILEGAEGALARRFATQLKRAVNATGVLLHTNLGRAPLSRDARAAVEEAAAGYSTVEYDAATGGRGKRQEHVRGPARDLFGCEDALAVNNNASAVFLALCALARGRRVLISRGELVAIGGSFQIPSILEASGAILAEVGTTNRTTIDDYRRALRGDVGALLTVHPSNYEIRGFTASPEPAELAQLAASAGIPWIHDQGTGCVVDLAEFGVANEKTVTDCIGWGAHVVTFSGDKLFGGPQAGIAAGRASAIGAMARHPVARVVRPDKLTLAALRATLLGWKTGAWREMPLYRAAAEPIEALERRAAAIRLRAGEGRLSLEIVESQAVFGGGTSPEKSFPSRALAVSSPDADPSELAARLRGREVPVIARVESDRLYLDMRSIFPEEDGLVGDALSSISI